MDQDTRDHLIARARDVLQAEGEAVRALALQLDEHLPAVVSLLARCEGHVLVSGAGTSAAIAHRFAHLLSCAGVPALPISAADSLHGSAGAVTARDIVYIISKGGRSAEVNQFAAVARERGARVIAQTEDPASPLAGLADAVLPVVAPQDVDPFGGLMALGSSLVNAAAGDALCALLLEAKGYSLEEFGRTHPGGAVGQKLSQAAAKSQDEKARS